MKQNAAVISMVHDRHRPAYYNTTLLLQLWIWAWKLKKTTKLGRVKSRPAVDPDAVQNHKHTVDKQW